jgi:WD repeat-containing protein 19
MGNYRGAHKTLVDTCIMLQSKGVRIPSDLRRTLMLLHSYLIVKHLVKPFEDHNNASRMLLRVARNIQKFPQHIPAILTSTVLECIKGDFKQSAYEYACTLIQSARS